MDDLFSPMTLERGPAWPNRCMLAPLTNQQSHADGTLSDDEERWLVARAEGGFGLVMTCAAHVQRIGQGFAGQLGVFDDIHLPGLARLAAAIRSHGAVSSLQLHHAGLRAPRDLVGEDPVGPSDDAGTGARALRGDEVEGLVADFVAAAARAEKAGFDGVEIHGAHGYILCAFLSAATNRRDDAWGGSLEKRSRILLEIVAGIRRRCRPGFQLGLRLSPERFGVAFGEMRELAASMMASGDLDYLDMSLWDCMKEPVDKGFAGRPLVDWFAGLPRGRTRLGVAGKLRSGAEARRVLERGVDFAVIGRAAILHHDWPKRVRTDPGFVPVPLPAAREHLLSERLSPSFVEYLAQSFPGFVADAATPAGR